MMKILLYFQLLQNIFTTVAVQTTDIKKPRYCVTFLSFKVIAKKAKWGPLWLVNAFM